MRTSILMMSLAVAAMAFTSCNKDKNETVVDNWNGEIRLSSGVTVQTRAFGIDQQINSGQKVAVYVDKVGTPATQLYGNNVLTANGAGGFTDGALMLFPADRANVNIYAIATNGTLAETFPTTAITHTVKENQTEKANYASSDLLYAANTGVARTKEAVNLTFYHMLSKVEVALVSGAGSPNLTGATVKIFGTKLKADFAPSKTMATQSDCAAMIKSIATTDATPITIGNTPSASFEAEKINYNEAVIVPQTVASGTKFIEVTLSPLNTVLTYQLKAETTFESGKKYQYKITVNLNELSVTSKIKDWESIGDPVEGSAEMQPIGSKVDTEAVMGDFYFSDGSLESGTAELTDDQKKACLGIVLKVGRVAEDDCQYKLKDGITPMTTIHGYVLALHDANNGYECTWGSAGTEVGTKTEQNTDFYGYKNTNTIKACITDKTLEIAFPATYYATDAYEKIYPAPANSSGWFLPSAGQCLYWLNNEDAILASVKRATGESGYNWKEWYWSSSESDYSPAYGAWVVNFGNGSVGTDGKDDGNYVRGVFAF